jgi:hypothetical protein
MELNYIDIDNYYLLNHYCIYYLFNDDYYELINDDY